MIDEQRLDEFSKAVFPGQICMEDFHELLRLARIGLWAERYKHELHYRLELQHRRHDLDVGVRALTDEAMFKMRETFQIKIPKEAP